MAQLQFDANQVKPQEAFEPVPKGWYNLRITESETKPTKDGTGALLALTIEVIDGNYVNRKIFDRLNLWNANPVASEIAQRRLSAYCHATGVMQLQDSQQLHGIPFKGRVSIREDKTGQYEPSNEIKDVKHINDPAGTSPTAQQGFTPPQAPAVPQNAAFAPPATSSFQQPPQMPPQQPPQQAQPMPAMAPPKMPVMAPPAGMAQPLSGGPKPPWAK